MTCTTWVFITERPILVEHKLATPDLLHSYYTT